MSILAPVLTVGALSVVVKDKVDGDTLEDIVTVGALSVVVKDKVDGDTVVPLVPSSAPA